METFNEGRRYICLILIFWCRYHESRSLKEGDTKYDFWYKRGLAMLNINDVSPEDGGQYSCTATNTAGTCSTMGELAVQGTHTVNIWHYSIYQSCEIFKQ